MRGMYAPDATPYPQRSLFCDKHAQRTAVISCTRCRRYCCDTCLGVGYDQRVYCFRCVPEAPLPLATRSSRFVAVLLDQFALIMCVNTGIATSMPLSLSVLGVLGMICCQFYLLATTGQSLGKRVMGIQVVRTDGSLVNPGRLIILRCLVPMFLGVLTCNIFNALNWLMVLTQERLALHDMIADTMVIKVGSKPIKMTGSAPRREAETGWRR